MPASSLLESQAQACNCSWQYTESRSGDLLVVTRLHCRASQSSRTFQTVRLNVERVPLTIHGNIDRLDQVISELSAFGSPVRPLMVTVILIHGLLVLAFGVGVLRASSRRSLSWVGGLLIAIGVVGFPTHTVWAMSSRDMGAGFNLSSLLWR